MPLFANINDLKIHLGGAISKTIELVNLQPFIDKALYEQVLPKVSAAQYEAFTANNVTLTGNKLVAFGLLKNAVAWFALHEYSTVGNVMMTEGGLMRMETETMKTSFKYQEYEFRAQCLRTAWFNVDLLLSYLLKSSTDFQAYHDSDEKKRNTIHLLNAPQDFRNCEARVPDRITFEALLPYIADVEEFCVRDFLGQTLWDTLHAAQFTPNGNAETAAKQKQLTNYLRKGIVEFVFHLAAVGNIITYKGSSVVVTETYLSDAANKSAPPPMPLLAAEVKQRRDWADRYFARAESYIRDNATTFSSWQGFTEEAETTPQSDFFTQAADRSNRLKSL